MLKSSADGGKGRDFVSLNARLKISRKRSETSVILSLLASLETRYTVSPLLYWHCILCRITHVPYHLDLHL